MSDTPSTIELDESGCVWIRLRGRIEAGAVDELSTELLSQFEQMGSVRELIVDMRELEMLTTEARLRLTKLQWAITGYKARTAFIAHRPRFRGVGLFIAHNSGDPNARAFHSLAQAKVWLQSREGRMERLVSWRDRFLRSGTTQHPKRHSSGELRAQVRKLRQPSDDGESSKEDSQ